MACQSAISILDSVRARVFQSRSDAALPDWIYGNVRMRGSPIGSRFDIDATPWLKEPLDALTSPITREVVVSAAAQLGKSVMACGYASYALAELKQSVIVVLDTQAQSDVFNQTKLFPMVKSCAKVRAQLPSGRDAMLKSRIHLEASDLLTGPANNSFLRSHSAPVIIGDEVSKWEAGSIQNARARTRQFAKSKCLFISTPLFEESDFGQAWMAGTRERWAHRCLGCGRLFVPLMKTLQWDKSCGRDIDLIKENLAMVCPLCGHRHGQSGDEVRQMNEGGEYLTENPDASKRVRSFMFSALSLPERLTPWIDLVEEFLKAKESIETGFDAPLKEFINLQLGEFWQGAGQYGNEFKFVTGKELTGMKVRLATIDVQRDMVDYWMVIRDWKPNGDSRLVHFDNVGSLDEIEGILKKYGVKPNHVVIDCAYQQARVLQECARRKWLPVRGTSRLHFNHRVGNGKFKRTIRRLYSPAVRMNHIPAESGRAHYCIELATDPLRDLFVNLRDGRSKVKWESGFTETGEFGEQYVKQITAMQRTVKTPVGGVRKSVWTNTYIHDHAFDCEVYQVAGALMLNLPFSKTAEMGHNKISDSKVGYKKSS